MAAPATKRILTVSELAGAARFLLEERFALVWVAGEISNMRIPGSGHWYFTLKDDKAQIRCAMFASRNRQVRFKVTDGAQVVLRGRVSLYEPRGDFQIIGEHMEQAGAGALQAAFDALKAKLAAEGLFAPEIKRPLPAYPRHVAVVTSRTGAALRDILAVFRRRSPLLRVTVLPVAVQGADAEAEIVRAFARLDAWPTAQLPRPDVVILARGGGSLEDLWAFNLEGVARAIRDCPLPVVAAVGHETDVTIADFVADLRAPTPSAGAELVAPHVDALLSDMARSQRALVSHLRATLEHHRMHVAHLERRLVHPGRMLQQHMQRLDDGERRLHAAHVRMSNDRRRQLTELAARLRRIDPRQRISTLTRQLTSLQGRLTRGVHASLESAKRTVAQTTRALNAVSPLDTLDRGYAILMVPPLGGERWGSPVTRTAATRAGEKIVAQLADGRLTCTVEEVVREDA